jgi:hypothetical protein
MNTIITRHYPASKLPEELREGIDPSSLVTVTVIQRTISPQAAAVDRDEIAGARQPAILRKRRSISICIGEGMSVMNEVQVVSLVIQEFS